MQKPEVHPFAVARDTVKKSDILEDRKVRQESKILVDDAEAEVDPGEGVQLGHVVTVQFNFARVRRESAGNDFDQGRFSGSVGSCQAMNGSRTNRQVHILQNGRSYVGLRNVSRD